jgi:hypothetical protein
LIPVDHKFRKQFLKILEDYINGKNFQENYRMTFIKLLINDQRCKICGKCTRNNEALSHFKTHQKSKDIL